jgi:hypothetical protein
MRGVDIIIVYLSKGRQPASILPMQPPDLEPGRRVTTVTGYKTRV